MNAAPWDEITRAIRAATGRTFSIGSRQRVTGGCINETWRIDGGNRRYFVKINDAARFGMFQAEAAGIAALASADAIRVPRPICTGTSGGSSWLILEYIPLRSRDAASDRQLGAGLAKLHRNSADLFGWSRDNTIGSSAQANPQLSDWPAFWRNARLAPQLARARRYGAKLQASGEALLVRLDCFFTTYRPVPALLHGDLWSGNAAATADDGSPVVFDPAVYYGDREADVAMTELFGGFSACFYSAYRDAFPLHDGYETRRDLYNLYHVLNHLNLFGASYLAQAEHMTARLLAATR